MMADLLIYLNAAMCLLLCAVLGWLIMAPTVRDGVIIKLGLILSAMGMLGCALVLLGDVDVNWRGLMAAWLLVNVGVLVVVSGLVLRVLHDPVAREMVQAVSGWPPLGDGHDGPAHHA